MAIAAQDSKGTRGGAMRIAVHAKVLSETDLTGIGVYVLNVLRALARIDRDNEYVLYSNEPLRHTIDAPNFHTRILRFPRAWSYLRLPFEFVDGRTDVLFMPKEMLPPLRRPPTVLVVYDLMGLLFPDRISLAAKVHFAIAVRWAIPRADAVIAISQATKQHVVDACGVAPARITVTHLGYDPARFRPPADGERLATLRREWGVRGDYFLNTSSVLWHRKNLVRLLQALAELRSSSGTGVPQLVLTGKPGEGSAELLEWRRRLDLERDVVLTGWVPEADVPHWLAGALALVFPSLDEGFGLPLVEAMACGCPVVSSNRSAMPEVVGEAGLLVDPLDTHALAAAMRRIASEPDLRARLRQAGLERVTRFSWDATARATLEVLRRAARARG